MTSEQEEPRVIGCLCGNWKSLRFSEAHRNLWTTDLGWVWPLDWYRSGGGECAPRGHVSEKLTKPDIHFLLEILTRQTRSVTVNDRCFRNEADRPPSRNLITVWASHAGKLCPSKELFIVQTESEFGGVEKPYGYLMRYDVSWLLIKKADEAAGFINDVIPWGRFLEPPEQTSVQPEE